MKKSRDRSLSAIIVDFYESDRGKYFMVRRDKIGKSRLEPIDNLAGGIYVPLVNGKTPVSVVNFAGESHHARKDASAQLPTQHGIVFLASDEGTGVEAMPLEANLGIGTFKSRDVGGYVNGLVMKHHAENIETRFAVRETKVPRLVNEYAKDFFCHADLAKKREWRDENPATHAESFPRIPVTPAITRRSVGILPNHGYERKGEMSVSAEFAEFEVAA